MNEPERQDRIVRLAAHTPARDWVRLRLTGRLDWRRVVAESGLPDPLAAVVTQVVARSRLWRLEKADLAAELCAHFSDGIDADTQTEKLMADFGNPRTAAALIKRAKKRNRHWAYRGFIHTCQGIGAILLALLIAYALLAWRFFASEPKVSRNYAAEYDEAVEAIPEEDRAWPLYLETFAMAEEVPETIVYSWPNHAPEHPRYAEAVAFLESQQDVIALLRTAADRPHLGAPFRDALDPRIVDAMNKRNPGAEIEIQEPSDNPMLIGVLLPELAHMRAMARLLAFDAHVAARAGDADRVMRDLETMLGVARHAGDRPVLISGLVRLAAYQLAANTVAGIIHARPDLLTDEQLLAIAHTFAALDSTDLSEGIEGERSIFADMVQRTYSDDGAGNGYLTFEGMKNLAMMGSLSSSSENLVDGPASLGPITAMLVADRAALTAKFDELMTLVEARAATPMWRYDEIPRASDRVEALAESPMDRVRYFPIIILMPAMDRAAEQGEYIAQTRDALLTGIALELHRRLHGNYPASLEDLVPAYLPAVPPDRFTGAPLNYAVVDGQPRLWSVGADRDDDGGVRPSGSGDASNRWIPEEAVQTRLADAATAANLDGDWVLWPVVYEPIQSDDAE